MQRFILYLEQDFYDLTMAYLTRCFERENVRHVEAFFDPQAHTMRGVSFETVVNGIYRALLDGKKKYGITFRLILCMLRDQDVKSALETLESAKSHKDKITAIGLDSNEIGHPPSKFEVVFAKAKKEGFLTVGHGGHDGPPDPYIWELLTSLHVQRIDHGVTCVEDPKLVQKIKELKLPMTVCPISNVKIGPYPTMKDHPIKQMIDAGLLVSINSDDPAYLGAYITDNIITVTNTFNLSKAEVVSLIKNAVISSFMTQEEQKIFLEGLQNKACE